MFTPIIDKYFENEDGKRLRYVVGACSTKEELPTEDIVNGSQGVVMTESTLYMYDAELGAWGPFIPTS